MRSLKDCTQFRKDYKRMTKRGKDMGKLKAVVRLLVDEHPLPERYRDHALTGEFKGYRDCHIEPDWLLIYGIEGDTLNLLRTGTHADLFE